ncbi:hypothetical protein L596_016712 [Steinernema carpocapsae]|uniref:Uncharacterized protein n=1 Tax=Steinernema carpocapsae TaxID=34508 RepID=A0A4U5NIS6_STECR|nr:hypothetical protein L596_016712 [Steinernema carpocapsae]
MAFQNTQNFQNPQLSRVEMKNYLMDPLRHECRVTISHSNVVQKSYDRERRFFALPPTVTLQGDGWQNLRQWKADLYLLTKPVVSNGIQWYQTTAGIRGVLRNGHQPGDKELEFKEQNFAQAKDMSITVEDPRFGKSSKTNFFELTLDLYLTNDCHIGRFKSAPIKVISKKPKQKQSHKNDCRSGILSGSTVSLFCKTKALPARYMFADASGFVGSTEKWTSIEIQAIDEVSGEEVGGYISFGQVVKLIDRKSGICHPLVRIQKVEGKDKMKIDHSGDGKPVDQLFKCAFQLMEQGDKYLVALSDNKIEHYDAYKDNQLSDAAIWTIASCEDTEYRFYLTPQAIQSLTFPLPIAPTVSDLMIQNGKIYLEGKHFREGMEIWLGDMPMMTEIENNWRLFCAFPDCRYLSQMFMSIHPKSVEIQVSVVFGGIVYATGQVLQLDLDTYRKLKPEN